MNILYKLIIASLFVCSTSAIAQYQRQSPSQAPANDVVVDDGGNLKMMPEGQVQRQLPGQMLPNQQINRSAQQPARPASQSGNSTDIRLPPQ